MLLYNSAVSGNCYKVRLLAAHLGIPLELEELSVVDRSNRAEVLGNLNPARRVPTLVLDDGRPLAESNAIIWYLGDGTQYAPTDPYERAQVLQWQFFEQYQVRAVARRRPLPDRLLRAGREARRQDRGADRERLHRARRDGAPSRGPRLPRRRAVHARGHLALRVHPRGTRGRLRPRAIPGDSRVDRPGRRASPATSRSTPEPGSRSVPGRGGRLAR